MTWIKRLKSHTHLLRYHMSLVKNRHTDMAENLLG